MSDYFVDSGAGGAATGADWANAFLTLNAALGVATSADTIYVANTHAGVYTSNTTLTFPSSFGLRVLCVTPSGSTGNSGLATGALEYTNANVNFILIGHAYVYGIRFRTPAVGTSAAKLDIATSTSDFIFEACDFLNQCTHTTAGKIALGASGVSAPGKANVRFRSCAFGGAITSTLFNLRGGFFEFENCTVGLGAATPSVLFEGWNSAHNAVGRIDNSDLTGKSWTYMYSQSGSQYADILARNCKLPASVSTSAGGWSHDSLIRWHNCDDGDTQHGFRKETQFGTSVHEETIVRTGGGSTSVRMDCNSNALPNIRPIYIEGSIYNSTTGSSVTLTVPIVHDSATALDDDEVWVEVLYQGTSGYPLGLYEDDRAADVLATPSAQTSDSGSTWTGHSFTNENKQKINVSFTAQEAGYVVFRVCLAAGTAKTIYADVYGASIA